MPWCPMVRDLDKELGIDALLAAEASSLVIRLDTRRFGKQMTVIQGFDHAVDVPAVAKMLKHTLGTGGTARDHVIELQGDHVKKARDLLAKEGYAVE